MMSLPTVLIPYAYTPVAGRGSFSHYQQPTPQPFIIQTSPTPQGSPRYRIDNNVRYGYGQQPQYGITLMRRSSGGSGSLSVRFSISLGSLDSEPPMLFQGRSWLSSQSQPATVIAAQPQPPSAPGSAPLPLTIALPSSPPVTAGAGGQFLDIPKAPGRSSSPSSVNNSIQRLNSLGSGSPSPRYGVLFTPCIQKCPLGHGFVLSMFYMT